MTTLAHPATLLRPTETIQTQETPNTQPSWRIEGSPKITHLGEGIGPVIRNIKEEIGLVIDRNHTREQLMGLLLELNDAIELFPDKNYSDSHIDITSNANELNFSFQTGNGELITLSRDPKIEGFINIKISHLRRKDNITNPNDQTPPPSKILHCDTRLPQITLLQNDGTEISDQYTDHNAIISTVGLFNHFQSLFPQGFSFDAHISRNMGSYSERGYLSGKPVPEGVKASKNISANFGSQGFGDISIQADIMKR